MIDITVHYMVTKEENAEVDIDIVIKSIIGYIQNNEIYFSYMPKFYEGVLLFGIVGHPKDHLIFQTENGPVLKKLHCLLHILTERLDLEDK